MKKGRFSEEQIIGVLKQLVADLKSGQGSAEGHRAKKAGGACWPEDGRGVRHRALPDAFTRECLSLEVDTSLSSRRVTRSLEAIVERRGMPEAIRCDNGPELTSRQFIAWCEERKIQRIHIQPGRPMQNGHVESFNGRRRDECLNANWFATLVDARAKITAWREEYDGERPHSSLGYRTLNEVATHTQMQRPSLPTGPF